MRKIAVAVYITNEREATEVAVDTKASTEIVIVSRNTLGAVPIRLVGRAVPGVKVKRIGNLKSIVQGEVL